MIALLEKQLVELEGVKLPAYPEAVTMRGLEPNRCVRNVKTVTGQTLMKY
jgi:hypothetical protein